MENGRHFGSSNEKKGSNMLLSHLWSIVNTLAAFPTNVTKLYTVSSTFGLTVRLYTILGQRSGISQCDDVFDTLISSANINAEVTANRGLGVPLPPSAPAVWIWVLTHLSLVPDIFTVSASSGHCPTAQLPNHQTEPLSQNQAAKCMAATARTSGWHRHCSLPVFMTIFPLHYIRVLLHGNPLG